MSHPMVVCEWLNLTVILAGTGAGNSTYHVSTCGSFQCCHGFLELNIIFARARTLSELKGWAECMQKPDKALRCCAHIFFGSHSYTHHFLHNYSIVEKHIFCVLFSLSLSLFLSLKILAKLIMPAAAKSNSAAIEQSQGTCLRFLNWRTVITNTWFLMSQRPDVTASVWLNMWSLPLRGPVATQS